MLILAYPLKMKKYIPVKKQGQPSLESKKNFAHLKKECLQNI